MLNWFGWITALALLAVAATPKDGARIGVCDLDEVFAAHPKKTNLEKELTVLGEELQQKLGALESKIKKQKAELDLLEPGTPTYSRIEKSGFSLSQELKYEQAQAARRFDERRESSYAKILEEVLKSVEAFGRDHGFDVILLEEVSLSKKAVHWKPVLYHSPQVDVTQAIVDSFAESNKQ